jgi:hypothetical protein
VIKKNQQKYPKNKTKQNPTQTNKQKSQRNQWGELSRQEINRQTKKQKLQVLLIGQL